MKQLSLYIHIPFCVQKCHYCDFLSAPCDEETRQKYVDTLCVEIKHRAKRFRDREVDTIFFGGGTPSVLSAKQFAEIMTVIRQEFKVCREAEISVEMNPGTVNGEKLEAYGTHGVNRLSIGLQSADNEELKILGRIHSWETFVQTWNLVREMGFHNVNIDLMSALPGQTIESYESTLRKVLALRPEHISAYSLIIEEGTKFYDWFGEENAENIEQADSDFVLEESDMEWRAKKLPDETQDRFMYELTEALLNENGYYRYEISNYSKKGYECKHNVGYWKRKDYLGLGLGSASLISNVRSSNIRELQDYVEMGLSVKKAWEEGTPEPSVVNWQEESQELSVREQMEEFMFLGLRMMEGVSADEFEQQFGKTLRDVYGEELSKLEKQGLLAYHEKERRYALTLHGIDVSNQVFVEFIE